MVRPAPASEFSLEAFNSLQHRIHALGREAAGMPLEEFIAHLDGLVATASRLDAAQWAEPQEWATAHAGVAKLRSMATALRELGTLYEGRTA
jgi:hypothetical protein